MAPSADNDATAGSLSPMDIEGQGDTPDVLDGEEEAEDSGMLKPVAENTPLEILTGVVAGTTIVTSLAAMALEQSIVTIVAGLLACGVGPYAFYQQKQLTSIRNLKETHAAIEAEVGQLKAENGRLNESVQELGATVDRLEDVEEALDAITETQGQSVDEFQQQVEKNKEILAKMEENLRANVLQNLLSVVIRSDTDNDHVIDPEEIDDLMKRITRINGVSLNEEKFRDVILQSGGSLKSVMDVIRNLLSKDVQGDDQIFMLES